jgi:HSP20 family protein
MVPNVSLPALLNRLSRLPGELEDLVGNLAAAPRAWWMNSIPYPLVNVREDTDTVHIDAEVPGLTADQIEVSIRHGNELTIQGERPSSDGAIGAWHQQERGVGRFQRILTLPTPVDADNVEARLEQGVLRLKLPKAESVKAHRIPVRD